MENRNAHKFVKALHYDEIIISNINWLKSLKDRVQPQPKQEWSEEDDVMKQNCHQMLALLRPNSSELIKDTVDNCHHWLKSLKDRYTWKPSNEQIEVKKLGEIARHLIAVKQHIEDMRLSEDEWLLLEKIGYPERFKSHKGK